MTSSAIKYPYVQTEYSSIYENIHACVGLFEHLYKHTYTRICKKKCVPCVSKLMFSMGEGPSLVTWGAIYRHEAENG